MALWLHGSEAAGDGPKEGRPPYSNWRRVFTAAPGHPGRPRPRPRPRRPRRPALRVPEQGLEAGDQSVLRTVVGVLPLHKRYNGDL